MVNYGFLIFIFGFSLMMMGIGVFAATFGYYADSSFKRFLWRAGAFIWSVIGLAALGSLFLTPGMLGRFVFDMFVWIGVMTVISIFSPKRFVLTAWHSRLAMWISLTFLPYGVFFSTYEFIDQYSLSRIAKQRG